MLFNLQVLLPFFLTLGFAVINLDGVLSTSNDVKVGILKKQLSHKNVDNIEKKKHLRLNFENPPPSFIVHPSPNKNAESDGPSDEEICSAYYEALTDAAVDRHPNKTESFEDRNELGQNNPCRRNSGDVPRGSRFCRRILRNPASDLPSSEPDTSQMCFALGVNCAILTCATVAICCCGLALG